MKEKWQQFSQELYDLFIKRPEAIFNLLDALSSDGHQYKSVVEFTQSPCSIITDAITYGLQDADFKKIQAQAFKNTTAVAHFFYGPRPYAKAMREKEIVHFPNPAPGNKPICVGHQYSFDVG